MWKRIAPWATCGLLLAAAAGAQGDPSATETAQADLIAQILELQRQIEDLLAKLPPEVREDLRQRLAEPEAVEPATASEPPGSAVLEEAPPMAEVAWVPAAAPPVASAAPEAPRPRAPRRRAPREKCNTLQPLDENGDGRISSADRYWRYVYVWLDGNSDGQMQDREIESAYDQKIREIDVSLETFIRAKGSLGEIRLDDRVVLDLRGDGFSERSRRDDGVLLLDAKALRRGAGPELLGPGGETLDGFQAFRAGLEIRDASGQVVALNCPGARTADD